MYIMNGAFVYLMRVEVETLGFGMPAQMMRE
jgi:hypothetical protein